MVIAMMFGNKKNDPEETNIYRHVIKNTQIAQYREGFYARQMDFKWGLLYHLKGKEKKLIGKFGEAE